ncbi:unnamed protein product [Amoebophrya sp. A120]|nr:unnamed protein product [Amoebophrya sp. A120]|eukprot:GSA120T00002751001.1
MMHNAEKRRSWWDRVHEWLHLPGYQNHFDRALSDYEALGVFSLNSAQYDAVRDDLTPLDAHQDLHDYDPFVRYEHSSDPDHSFVDPYLAPVSDRVGLRWYDPMPKSNQHDLVDVLVQKPLSERRQQNVWRSEVEPSAPEDQWAYYTVPRFYRVSCQLSCEAQFAQDRARLLSDSDLRQHLRWFSDTYLIKSNKDDVSYRTLAVVSAASFLIDSTLVRYMKTGLHSVAKVDFRENLSA